MTRFLFIIFLGASAAFAQTYPDYTSTTVNDFADLLPDSEEKALSQRLEQLRRDTGVEMTVLTLPSQAPFASDLSLEAFATGLFNHWGIGDARRNDGVLVMVLRDDRAMRIELGAAYGRDWDRAAARVIDDHFLNAFAAGDYSTGLTEGSDAVIAGIVMPFRQGQSAPTGEGGLRIQNPDVLIYTVFAAIFAFALGRGRIGDALARFRRCPRCQKRGLRQRRRTTVAASTTSSGWGVKHVSCPHCGYEDERRYMIPMRTKSSSRSFGGGRSGGGGASGRW